MHGVFSLEIYLNQMNILIETTCIVFINKTYYCYCCYCKSIKYFTYILDFKL